MTRFREFLLTAYDRDGGQQEFTVREEPREGRPGWVFKIQSWSRPTDFFEATAFTVKEGVLQFDMVNHHGILEFKAKGIPEALYKAVARDRRCEIQSSATRLDPNNPEEDWLSEAGGKLWRRLEASKDAHFDEERARWVLPVPRSP